MPDPSRLALFVGAALLLLVVPGPSVLYIVTQSVSHGRRAGIASVAGITTGTLVHIAAATVGLSALLASSTLAFDVVKYLGAAYLVVVGCEGSPASSVSAEPHVREARDLRRLYRQGIVVNTLNPKTALFFLAFLPQFAVLEVGPRRCVGADPRARAALRRDSHFSFLKDRGSFAHATTRCVGVGKCRHTDGGVMCPSFMVTREEMHSTRGRAHLLWEMLNGEELSTSGTRTRSTRHSISASPARAARTTARSASTCRR